jgi:DNA topoisomerase-1
MVAHGRALALGPGDGKKTVTLVERLHRTGIRRLGDKKAGFRYAGADGAAVAAVDRERIEALRIPPAWRDVAIAPSPRSAVQAVGLDAAGRWQYRYHQAHHERREKRKQERLRRFARALPAMRAAIGNDLGKPGLSREKVLACAVRILSSCYLRPGSRVYTEENGSYGLTTLRRKHVSVSGDLVSLDFNGKSGKRQTRQLRDRRVARVLRELLQSPGKVFRFRDENGAWTEIRRRHINEYIKNAMGESFSAKDFRTWAATLICACLLSLDGDGSEESAASRRKAVVKAVRETAESLGNTPAVCRKSYIAPRVLRSYEKGKVIEACAVPPRKLMTRRSASLAPAEKAVLNLLGDR